MTFGKEEEEEKIITPSHQKTKVTRRQKQKLLTILKHSIRYELNERVKERRKKSNLMKNAKILAKGI